jgi:sugar lactone lactonase YvrE
MKRIVIASLTVAGVAALSFAAVKASLAHQVGDVLNGATLVPTGKWVAPHGITANLKSGVIDAVLTADGKTAIVKTGSGVAVIDVTQGKQLQELSMNDGTSMNGICLSPDEKTVACSGAGSRISLFHLDGRTLTFTKNVTTPSASVGGAGYPCGLQFVSSDTLVVAQSRDNSVLLVSVPDGKLLQRIPVAPAPYALLRLDPSRFAVSCWGRDPKPNGASAPSSGTNVDVDMRGIASGGAICVVNLDSGKVEARADSLGQPTEMALYGGSLYVADANADSIQMFDSTTLNAKGIFAATKLKASAPDSLVIDPATSRLYVAYGGLDKIAAYDLQTKALIGIEGTDWYPSTVRTAGQGGLVVCTAKGVGSRSGTTSKRGVYEVTGSVSYLASPELDKGAIDPAPERVGKVSHVPVPVPTRLGDPSVFKHVVYVIKENRTYDQLFGDIAKANGDPSLVMYGQEVTPNQHALANEFAVLDNYYCNGILSADGHAWATEANATTFYERSRGGWTRSYPFGDDPLATTGTGYVWDNALSHGVSVRNFGEFDYASPETSMTTAEIYRRFMAGDNLAFKQNIGVARLRKVSVRDFPGWNLSIPDVLRADRFIKHLHEEEKTGDMAALTILYFPQDHTSGGSAGYPTPRAQVADNDLAVGRAIEAISHSKFWSSTVVFVNEDDPQDGYDHVDGHRSICLVASPYTRRGAVVSELYNQTSVIHTIEQILGLPPMNHNDAESTLMTDCFQPKPDLTPYDAKPNQIPLDETKKAAHAVSFRLDKPDQVDDEAFNRELWLLAKGTEPPKRPHPRDDDGR